MGRLGPLPTIALAAVLALAGCLGAVDDEPVGSASSPSAAGAADAAGGSTPAAAAELGSASPLPTEPPTNGSRTLREAPTYRVGEHWTIDVQFMLSGNEATIQRVVAGTQGDDYLVGMPTESWNDETIVVHFPGMGRVDRTNLSFDAHDRPLQFLDFPLTEGHTWETQWYGGSPLEGKVVTVDGDQAEVRLEGESMSVRLVYDASAGAVTTFEVPGYLKYEVTDHGYGFQGEVRVPANRDLVFCHGRAGVAIPVEACQVQATSPRGPVESVDLADNYDRVSYALLAADLATAGPVAPGVHRVAVTHPSGQEETLVKGPHEPGYKLSVGGDAEPVGTWTVEAEAAGGGLAILEGVGYDSYTVTLGGN